MAKIQLIYIILIMVAVVGIIFLFASNIYFKLDTGTALSILAVILAPIIAIIVGEYLRLHTEKQREEYETLKTLVSFRHMIFSLEFLSALNRVVLVFDKNTDIKK